MRLTAAARLLCEKFLSCVFDTRYGAEERGASLIFSLDNDFRLYRTAKGGVLQVVP